MNPSGGYVTSIKEQRYFTAVTGKINSQFLIINTFLTAVAP